MKNPFNPQNLGEAHLKRNVFDLGRNSIFTNDFFKLYPFFCQEIIPGDTVRIDAQIGVRGMPTVFPVQTKCRASMEFYYVRNRTLMDNFEDYIFMTKDIEAPWLRLNNERAKQMISVGSLGDAFNIPTTVGFSSEVYSSVPLQFFPNYKLSEVTHAFEFSRKSVLDNELGFLITNNKSFILRSDQFNVRDNILLGFVTPKLTQKFDFEHLVSAKFRTTQTVTPEQNPDDLVCIVCYRDDNDNLYPAHPFLINMSVSSSVDGVGNSIVTYSVPNLEPLVDSCLSEHGNYSLYFGSIKDESNGYYYGLVDNSIYFPLSPTSSDLVPSSLYLPFITDSVLDSTDDRIIADNPFIGSNPDIRLNVLPWRAYEMCCNYYYRNEKNNPYVLNGESQYNEFIPTHADGPDDNVYDFHYRNWELDRFTSAIQSPQFGEAPLVGLTYSPTSPTADLTFQASLDGGETKDYTVKVGVNSDGDIDSIVDFDSDVPSANLQRLQRQIQAGISINDFRITNSFQRFLENTIRRGLRYRNQLKSHFGVSVDYPDIDVPQYIGGASGFLESGQVTNMAYSPNAGLGDYVGTLQGGISMRNKITHYCAEHGFIIGIFSLAPIPNYPQSISKVMIKTNPLDYYLPEFGKIGYVPIHYSELMPLQTPSDGSVDDVFGYQKAHYDYMQAFDEVHGDFRTNLRDFTLSRTFKERPLLSSAFTVGSPEQLNDIWVANNIADAYNSTAKFMCSSHVSCIMKREVAMIGTPSLE